MNRTLRFFVVSPLFLLISACNSPHTVFCNKLKSDLIFNGATSNTREAQIQKAEQPLVQHNYDKYCD